MNFIKESVCCEAAVQDAADQEYVCMNCLRECDYIEVCTLCDNTGEIHVPPKQVGGKIVDGYVEVCPHIKIAKAEKDGEEQSDRERGN